MFSESTQVATSEEFEAVAESLADLLARGGDHRGANEVLSIVSRQANTPALALRRAEHHLAHHDPSSALAAVIPVWEAGYDDSEVEGLMGITSLILGLEDVVENLTDKANPSQTLATLRWVLSCCDCEVTADIDLGNPKVQWSLIRLSRIFADQGRTDIVGAVSARLETIGATALLERMTAIPKRPWIQATPIHPPIDLRTQINQNSVLPAVDASYNWVWAAARQVFRGERVLLVGLDVDRFAPLFVHADLTVEALDHHDQVEASLQRYASGAFEHVIMVYGYETSCSPRDVTRLLWRVLRHGGQLHAVAATHRHAACFQAYVHPNRITAMLDAIGFELMGHQLRNCDGLPVDENEGSVLVLRAQKNLV